MLRGQVKLTFIFPTHTPRWGWKGDGECIVVPAKIGRSQDTARQACKDKRGWSSVLVDLVEHTAAFEISHTTRRGEYRPLRPAEEATL